jgi:hypothetical protein
MVVSTTSKLGKYRTSPLESGTWTVGDYTMRNPDICRFCKNKTKDVCNPCDQEGKYVWLDPIDISALLLPDMPEMRTLNTWPANDRLAIMYLYTVVQQRTIRRSAQEFGKNYWTQPVLNQGK